ncbi:MAG: hypothetical protein JNK87_18460 [Bryobacterales bacterium]|nr:hypothetical protein [Bryobacterales bacterium]
MKQFKSILAAAAVVALGTCIPQAQAGPWDKLTYLTVKEAIQVPGAQLPPGKYAVRLLESQSNRYIVQFFNDDRSKLFATVLAIPNETMEPVDNTQLRFYESRGNEPPALRAWFYPGETIGREFVYPKSEANTIAANSGRSVPSMDDETARSFMTRDAQATPVWKQEMRVYQWGPKNSEVATNEAAAMNKELDNQPQWKTRQTQYTRYYTWEDPNKGTTGTTTQTVTQTRSTQATTTQAGSTSASTPMPQGLTAQREDIQSVTRALEAHSDAFEKEFQKAVQSSTVRIADRDALVKMVDDLEDSFDQLRSDYSSNNMASAHRNLHKALEVASRVNDWMTQASFKTTEPTWSQIRQDLNTLAQAHGYALLENWGRGNASR